ncbi:MAG: cupin domain-containing protein [Verrucomicrobia bacterium]|nr:cupin domain-containing protein [Verrucomicrobiota bacterium]
MKKIDYQVAFRDQRGEISDLIENETINAITRITIRKGAVRGNHYHKETWQWNYLVSGKMKLVTRMPNEERREVILSPGDLAVTEPHEHHVLIGVEDCDVLVFTKGPRGGKEYETDTFRLEQPLALS